jgi:hypothetical protein
VPVLQGPLDLASPADVDPDEQVHPVDDTVPQHKTAQQKTAQLPNPDTTASGKASA